MWDLYVGAPQLGSLILLTDHVGPRVLGQAPRSCGLRVLIFFRGQIDGMLKPKL